MTLSLLVDSGTTEATSEPEAAGQHFYWGLVPAAPQNCVNILTEFLIHTIIFASAHFGCNT